MSLSEEQTIEEALDEGLGLTKDAALITAI